MLTLTWSQWRSPHVMDLFGSFPLFISVGPSDEWMLLCNSFLRCLWFFCWLVFAVGQMFCWFRRIQVFLSIISTYFPYRAAVCKRCTLETTFSCVCVCYVTKSQMSDVIIMRVWTLFWLFCTCEDNSNVLKTHRLNDVVIKMCDWNENSLIFELLLCPALSDAFWDAF